MNNSHSRKGFTLVEIMIVVVIIGLLAAMAIPTFAVIRQQSRVKAVGNNLRQIAHASAEYMLDKGVTQAGYTDISGTLTDSYVHPISIVSGEDYTTVVVAQTSTQISIYNVSFGTVTYNL